MYTEQQIIENIKVWIEKIIIGLNFCPFAKKDYVNNRVRYQVQSEPGMEQALTSLLAEFKHLDKHAHVATTLVVLPQGFDEFDEYLDLLDLANALLESQGYEGVYQLASFHPNYCFEGVPADDVSNYTNRSPWPILHIIREDLLTKVVELHPDPESIPHINMDMCDSKGHDYFSQLLTSLNSALNSKHKG
ncbi:DUF1415 domain-containing protein [Thalassotalea sp. Y01]|uniref:DUF1415 domain-containing protein n=1 Tax=Thalassotalea sp. Y01 TaxID=2729613 RepID=UPI00145FAE0D|nr:DUF1415 domain-containing protein [Thalassotalea sp. Y01]NMP15513.1 DUF1415 domain-containing protein [Thalassotalea sp. Y01]